MWSDHSRGLKIGLALFTAAGLGFYYAYVAATMDSGWRWCLEDPVARDGAVLVFPLWTVTAVDGPDRYEISKIISGIPVVGDTTDLDVGDTVSIAGHFDATAVTVVEDVREVHTLRRWKEGLSVLGFVFVALAAPMVFTIRGGRIRERSWPT